MSTRSIVVIVAASLFHLALSAYTYSSWGDLPQCAKNCLSVLVQGSTTWGCDGIDIDCACYDNPDQITSFFDAAYDDCITQDPWIAKNNTGGCKDHPSDQEVDVGELEKYEHDIFCFLGNATCPHSGCQSSPSSSSYPGSTSESAAATSQSSASSSASSTSISTSSTSSSQSAATTSSSSSIATPSVHLTTVGVVVTASSTAIVSQTTASESATTLESSTSSTGQTSGGLAGEPTIESTLALVMLVAAMMLLAG